MKRRGLFRLWIVATAFFVPGVAFWQVNGLVSSWQRLDDMSVQLCVNQEDSPNFNVEKCIHDSGAGQTAFQHEHTTAGAYWGGALGIAFILDFVLTALMIGAFLLVRWVIRGFKSEA